MLGADEGRLLEDGPEGRPDGRSEGIASSTTTASSSSSHACGAAAQHPERISKSCSLMGGTLGMQTGSKVPSTIWCVGYHRSSTGGAAVVASVVWRRLGNVAAVLGTVASNCVMGPSTLFGCSGAAALSSFLGSGSASSNSGSVGGLADVRDDDDL